jgi:hypoxanthine phosphoribosyltransferase
MTAPRTISTVERDVERILITKAEIAARIAEIGKQICHDLDNEPTPGEVMLVPILTGAVIFVADLMRQLPIKLKIGVVTVSSYPGMSMKSRGAQLASALPDDLEGRHVLIVDDILDSGGTIRLIREEVERRHPSSVRACVLLRKQIPSAMATPCEYVGFDIADEFVVGYGLDYDNYYRNLPEIGVLKPTVVG